MMMVVVMPNCVLFVTNEATLYLAYCAFGDKFFCTRSQCYKTFWDYLINDYE